MSDIPPEHTRHAALIRWLEDVPEQFSPHAAELIEQIRGKWKRWASLDPVIESVRLLARAIEVAEGNPPSMVPNVERFDFVCRAPKVARRRVTQAEADASYAARATKTRAQLEAQVSASDLDYLATRAGERRRYGQTYGQTEHMKRTAEDKKR